MPRKKPEELKSQGGPGKAAPTTTAAPEATSAPAAAPVAPSIPAPAPVATPATGFHEADTNGDGVVSEAEHAMYMEFKRKELEDQDAMRDAQRNMAWFSLAGMLFYPAMVVTTDVIGLDNAATILGDMAPTYFVAVAGLVAAFFGAQAWSGKK